MARILYGVMGDSRGHVSRSLAVAQLLPQHEFLFIGGGSVHELKAEGYNVEDAPMASTIRRDNRVDAWATLFNALKVFATSGGALRRLQEIIKSYDPHLILSDYEFFTPVAARRLGRPSVSLDHQHVLTHCQYTPPPGQTFNRLMTCTLVKGLYSSASRYMIISFFRLPPVNPVNTEVFPPVVRRAVQRRHSTEGEDVVVYLPDGAFHGLVGSLEGRKRKFIVYGMGKRPPRKNLVFKEKSTEGFADDMAACGFVISNAGHSLISEALYLAKPVLAFPRELEFEQFLNAHFLAHFGFGSYCKSVQRAAAALDDFESNLDRYQARVRRERFLGNDQLAARIEDLLAGPQERAGAIGDASAALSGKT